MREASGGGTIFLGAASASCCPLTRLLVCPDIRLSPGRCSAWLARVQMSQRTRSHGDRTCYVVQADLCMQVGRLARAVAQGPRFRRNAVNFSVGHPPIRLDHLPHARGVELTQGVEGMKQLTPNSGRQSFLRNPPQDFTDIPRVNDGYLSEGGVRRDPRPVSASNPTCCRDDGARCRDLGCIRWGRDQHRHQFLHPVTEILLCLPAGVGICAGESRLQVIYSGTGVPENGRLSLVHGTHPWAAFTSTAAAWFWWPEGVLARTNVTAAAERLTDPLSPDGPPRPWPSRVRSSGTACGE